MKKLITLKKAGLASFAGIASVGVFADYTTDVKPSFDAALAGLESDAFLMFGDAIPSIIAVATIGVLAALAVSMIRKMRA